MQNKKGFIIGSIVAALLPWLLIYIFMYLLTDISWMIVELDVLQFIEVLAYQTLGFSYSIPIIGDGFLIPLLIWITVGLVCGIIARSPVKGLLCTLIGLLVNLIFFMIVLMNPPVVLSIHQLIEPIGQIGLELITSLGLFLLWYSLILPGSAMGGLFGGVISRFRKQK